MKKRTLGVVAGGVVVLAIAGGGTYAGWSDFNVQDETVAAGHLTLLLGETDASEEPLRLAPGDNRFLHYYVASNDGDSVPDGELSVRLEGLEHIENGCENNGEGDAEGNGNATADEDLATVCGTEGELADETSVEWYFELVPDGTECGSVSYTQQIGTGGSLRDHDGRPSDVLGTLAPGEAACVSLQIMAEDVVNDVHVNEIQGDAVDFDVRFTLTQV